MAAAVPFAMLLANQTSAPAMVPTPELPTTKPTPPKPKPTKPKKPKKPTNAKEWRKWYPTIPAKVAKSKVDPVPQWGGANGCTGTDTPGAVSIKNLLHKTYGQNVDIGINRCTDNYEHAEGRAIDWMVDSGDPVTRAKGDAFVHWLTKKTDGVPGANARRMGVLYIVWKGQIWKTYDQQWQTQSGCAGGGGDYTQCHRDHVHISITWDRANKATSWWTKR